MPGPSSAVPNGNIKNTFILRVPVAAGAALVAGTQERTYIVPGLLAGDYVAVVKPTFQNNISIGGARVSAANTLGINFVAITTPTLAAEDYLLLVARGVYDNPATQLPTAIA